MATTRRPLTAAEAHETSALREACLAAASTLERTLGDRDTRLKAGMYRIVAGVRIEALITAGEPGTRRRQTLTDGQVLEPIADAVGPEMFGELLDRAYARRRHWWKGRAPKAAWSARSAAVRGQIDAWLKSHRLLFTSPVAGRTDRAASVTVTTPPTVERAAEGDAA